MADEQMTPSQDEATAGAPAPTGAPTPVDAPTPSVDPTTADPTTADLATVDPMTAEVAHQTTEPSGEDAPGPVSGQPLGQGQPATRGSGATAVGRPTASGAQQDLPVDGSEPHAGEEAEGAEAVGAEATVPEMADKPADAESSPAPVAIQTTGAFEPYTVGDPGRAFTHGVSLVEAKYRDTHDIVIDSATVPDADGTPRLALRAASCRGLSHAQYGDPRQDDHCVVVSSDGEWLVCLVADGVSSGEWSHVAAKMATEEGASHILKLLETHQPHEVPFRQVLDALADLLGDVCAQLPDAEPAVDLTRQEVARRMATTLVVAIVATRPGEDGTHPVTVVRVGDSSAWILDDDQGWINLGEVKNAGNIIAGSATASLPLVPDEDPVPVQTTLGAGAALLLMTDGIGDPLGSGQGEVGRHLASLWKRPPHALEFAAQAGFGRKTYDDDRGIIGIWLVDGE